MTSREVLLGYSRILDKPITLRNGSDCRVTTHHFAMKVLVIPRCLNVFSVVTARIVEKGLGSRTPTRAQPCKQYLSCTSHQPVAFSEHLGKY